MNEGLKKIRIALWILLVMTVLIVVIGGITRLTGSGLSMVDWRPLMGSVPPLSESEWNRVFTMYQQYPEYQIHQNMTLSGFKRIFFWEYLHRIVARVIGLLAFIPLILSFWAPACTRMQRFGFAMLPVWVLAQGILGWKMVQSGLALNPSVSHFRLAAHLLMAIGFLGYTLWILKRLDSKERPEKPTGILTFLWVFGGVLMVQLMYGAFTAGLKAGHVFNTFPKMGELWFPPDLWIVHPWYQNLLNNPFMVQFIHRGLAYVLVGMTVIIVGYLLTQGGGAGRGPLWRLVGLVGLQFVLGVLTLIFHVPVILGVAHQLVGLGVFAHVILAYHDLKYRT